MRYAVEDEFFQVLLLLDAVEDHVDVVSLLHDELVEVLRLDHQRLAGMPDELFLEPHSVDLLADEGVAFEETVEVKLGEVDVVGDYCLEVGDLLEFQFLVGLQVEAEPAAHLVDALVVLGVVGFILLLDWLEGVLHPPHFQVQVVLLLQLLVAQHAAQVLCFDLLQFAEFALDAGFQLLQFLLEVQDVLAHLLGLLERLLALGVGHVCEFVEGIGRLHDLLSHELDALGLLLHHCHQLLVEDLGGEVGGAVGDGVLGDESVDGVGVVIVDFCLLLEETGHFFVEEGALLDVVYDSQEVGLDGCMLTKLYLIGSLIHYGWEINITYIKSLNPIIKT